jgi:hypothetical protein
MKWLLHKFYRPVRPNHGDPQGETEMLLPPPPGRSKIVCFLTLLGGKKVTFLLFFRQKEGACTPLKIFALPWKKVCGSPWTKLWLFLHRRSAITDAHLIIECKTYMFKNYHFETRQLQKLWFRKHPITWLGSGLGVWGWNPLLRHVKD